MDRQSTSLGGSYRRTWFHFDGELLLLKVLECEQHGGWLSSEDGRETVGWECGRRSGKGTSLESWRAVWREAWKSRWRKLIPRIRKVAQSDSKPLS